MLVNPCIYIIIYYEGSASAALGLDTNVYKKPSSFMFITTFSVRILYVALEW